MNQFDEGQGGQMSLTFAKSGYERGYALLATFLEIRYLIDIVVFCGDCVVPAPGASNIKHLQRFSVFFAGAFFYCQTGPPLSATESR